MILQGRLKLLKTFFSHIEIFFIVFLRNIFVFTQYISWFDFYFYCDWILFFANVVRIIFFFLKTFRWFWAARWKNNSLSEHSSKMHVASHRRFLCQMRRYRNWNAKNVRFNFSVHCVIFSMNLNDNLGMKQNKYLNRYIKNQCVFNFGSHLKIW